MPWFEEEDDEVPNVKVAHDSYMAYARDLLHETQSGLDRIASLSREIQYLTSQIQPSWPDDKGEVASERGWNPRPLSRQPVNSKSPTSAHCTNTEDVLSRRFPVCKPGTNPIHSPTGLLRDTPLIEMTGYQQAILYKEAKQQRKSAPMLKPTTLGPASQAACIKLTNEQNQVGNKGKKHAKSLKLCIVLPGCGVDQEEAPGVCPKPERCYNSLPNAGAVRKPTRKQISRESLRIPRVIIQSFAPEKYLCDIKLPAIMENFPRPLQLTARKFRLPSLRNESA